MTGWPNPARPGVPLNSERDGWHIVTHSNGKSVPRFWRAAPAEHWEAVGWSSATPLPPADAARAWRYEGMMHTPAEVAALAQERDAANLCAAEAVVALNNRDSERMRAEREARKAEAERDALRAVLVRWQHYGCPDCGGDCASANPPVACCIMQETRAALAAKEGGQ